MITLNSVCKIVGKAESRRTVLENVTWTIPRRTHVAILGTPQSGAAMLMDIIGGMILPTSGWVSRQAIVSIPGGLLRYAMRDTTRQLILRLSYIYRADPAEVMAFVSEAVGDHVLDIAPNLLQKHLKQYLNIALTYAFPCDFYLLHSPPNVQGDPKTQAFFDRALALRGRHAGVVIRSSSAKAARRLDQDMMGAIVYGANLTLYGRLSDAIAVFENLPPEEETTSGQVEEQTPLSEEDIIPY